MRSFVAVLGNLGAMAVEPRVVGILVIVVCLLGACSAVVPPPTDEAPAAPAAPAAPLLSNGTGAQTSITVTWTAPVAELTIAGYELQWRSGTDMAWIPATGIASSATSYTIHGLQPEVTYQVRVRALFPTTVGAWSESITVSTTTAPAPAAPSLAAPTAHANRITVTWTAPATSESITGYELQWRSGTDMAWIPVTGIASSATSYTIHGLQPEVAYQVRVRALFAMIDGAWSDVVTVPTAPATPTTPPPATPTAPPPATPTAPPSQGTADFSTGVCLKNTHPNSITVTWTALATKEPVTGYELQWRPLFYGTDWYRVNDIASTENSYTLTGLQLGFFFLVRVHAWHGNDAGPWFDGKWCSILKEATTPRFKSFPVAAADTPVSEAAAEHSFNIFSYYRPKEHYPVTVKYRLTETGNVLHSAGEHTATVSNEFSNYFKVRLIDDDDDEADSTVTITILPGPRYHVGTLSSYTFTVTDDDD